MKTYLTMFFREFEYEHDDATVLLSAYEAVVNHAKAKACFDNALAEYQNTGNCNFDRITALADEAAGFTHLHEYTIELLVYICLTEELRTRYRRKGFTDTMFHDAMLDLRYKLEECKAVKGVVGTFVPFWYAGFFDMTRFAFGRLQFELCGFEGAYEKNGKRLNNGDTVINVHIPRTGTPLDKALCDEAYKQAADFFADRINGDVAFVCYSWLLYPENETILTTKSNIVRFMKQYDILRSGISKDKSDLWRLFDTEESHPDRLPTDTTARKRYVEHIRAGGKLGWGYGVFFAQESL